MCIVLCFMLMVVLMPVMTVYAGDSPDKLSDKAKKRAKALYQYLISNGYTKESACGVLANADQESGFEISINDSGTYKGTFQFDSTQAESIKKFASKNNLDPEEPVVQYMWIETEKLPNDFKTYGKTTLDDFKALKDVDKATELFCGSYERPLCFSPSTGEQWCQHHKPDQEKGCLKGMWNGKSVYLQHLGQRQIYGREFLKAYAGIEAVDSNGSNLESSSEDSNIEVKDGEYGFINSDGLFVSLEDSIIEFKSREDLSDSQIKGVIDWRDNIAYENEGFIYKALRVFIMFSGIVTLVWIILVYLSYWFDRVNNFLDIDLLPILTAGRLRVSPEESECTFDPKNFTKGDSQTVNHRVIIGVCCLGIFFAVLVISGTFYKWLGFLIRYVLKLLGVMG